MRRMLQQIVYVAVRCKFCLRASAVALNREELSKKIADREPIELFCAYDEQRWVASARELISIIELLNESNYEI
jgi:hypothetical protein